VSWAMYFAAGGDGAAARGTPSRRSPIRPPPARARSGASSPRRTAGCS
jgi:hypothetical protein